MPLSLLYKDPDTNEEKLLFIKICLNTDYDSENTVTEHPAETKKMFTDNSLENLQEIPVTVFISGSENREEFDFSVINNNSLLNTDVPTTLTPLNLRTNSPVFPQLNVIPVNYGITTETIEKQSVLDTLEKLKKRAVIIDQLIVNNRPYSNFLLKKIHFLENIDTGDGWDIDLIFKEARKVKSETTTISEEKRKALQEALKKAIEKNNGSEKIVTGKIVNSNKISDNKNKGNTNTIISDQLNKYNNAYPSWDRPFIRDKSGKYFYWNANSSYNETERLNILETSGINPKDLKLIIKNSKEHGISGRW